MRCVCAFELQYIEVEPLMLMFMCKVKRESCRILWERKSQADGVCVHNTAECIGLCMNA